MTKEELTEIRVRHRLKPKDFANALGVDPSYLSLIERGKRPLSDSFKFKVERFVEENFSLRGLTDIVTRPLLVNDKVESFHPRPARAGRTEGANYLVRIRTLLMKALEDLQDGQYDLFDVDGLSMMPTMAHGDKLLCKLVTVNEIIDNRIYVIVTNRPDLVEFRRSGVWVKRLQHRKNNGYINCKSDNKDTSEPYQTFRLKPDEVDEVWYPVRRITANMDDPNRDIYDKLDELEGRVEMLESLNE